MGFLRGIALALLATGMAGLAQREASASADAMLRGHSHNDYQQSRPLWDALDNHLYSVEADVWLKRGEILVSHTGIFFKGELEANYLEPLQARVDRLGSVYGDGRPFILWIDIKQNDGELLQRLAETLDRYPMLSTFTDTQQIAGPVTVVLTGDENMKRRLVEDFPIRKAVRDHLFFEPEDPGADLKWTWYALKWTHYFHWRGHGEPPARFRQKLCALVAGIHAKNRKVRFFKVPARQSVWKAAYDCGADLIGSDNLPMLSRFLEAQP